MASKYQGWANYETWCVSLWIDNDGGSYRFWREARNEACDDAEGQKSAKHVATCALADRLKETITDEAPELEGMWADLLGAALSEVDWFEIAEHLIEE